MKNAITMLDGLCRKYHYDTSHRQIVDGIKCAFVPTEELITYYGLNGFTTVPNKYVMSAWDKHIVTWERLQRAQRTTIDGIDGVLIQLTATA